MKRLLCNILNQLPKMANLPPRKFSSSSRSSKQDTTPLQVLLQMGFPRHRALKALAATGNRSVQLASDWLLTHVNDAHLDMNEPREYIFYASPTGSLLTQLLEFWEKSKKISGWNGAHNFPPHITLVSFFKAPDETSLQLAKAVKHVVENVGEPPNCPLKVEPYMSHNFMGLFVSDQHADYLKRIAVQYVKQVSSALGVAVDTYEHLDTIGTCFPWCAMPQQKPYKSVSLEPHVKSLHITLAYHFDVAVYDALKGLVDDMQPFQQAGWELRLYSRDPRFANYQVYKVTQGYEPKASDELELVLGDYIYMKEDEVNSTPDGWLHGTSWLTGNRPFVYAPADVRCLCQFVPYQSRQCSNMCRVVKCLRLLNLKIGGVSGYLPAVYTRRTAESDAWTLHRAISLANNNSGDCKSESDSNTDGEMSYPHEDASMLGFEKSQESYKEWDKYWNTVKLDRTDGIFNVTHGASIDWQTITTNGDDKVETEKKQRWVFAMRHGERVDLTYGQWVPHCFDGENYVRKDLNMPLFLAERMGGKESYAKDTPLTRVGRFQAWLVGEGLRLANIRINHVYASAALRCVETAHEMLLGLQADPSVKIRVEPGLFEYKAWHLAKGLATFMTPAEFHCAGLNVDLDYKPYFEVDVNTPETVEEFFHRNEKIIQTVANETEASGDNVIFVGHASTLDMTTFAIKRLDQSVAEQKPYQLSKNLLRVPYCALAALRPHPWRLVCPPCPPSINSSSGRFDWTILEDTDPTR